MTSDRAIFFIMGVAITLLVNLAMDTIRRWRDTESDRKKTRAVANMFRIEIEKRLLYLNHGRSSDSDITIIDVIYINNSKSSGRGFEFSRLEGELRKIFDTFSDYLVQLDPAISEGIVSHYQGAQQRLEEFIEQISIKTQSRKDSLDIINELRNETRSLIDAVVKEIESMGPRPYRVWLPGWVRGTL